MLTSWSCWSLLVESRCPSLARRAGGRGELEPNLAARTAAAGSGWHGRGPRGCRLPALPGLRAARAAREGWSSCHGMLGATPARRLAAPLVELQEALLRCRLVVMGFSLAKSMVSHVPGTSRFLGLSAVPLAQRNGKKKLRSFSLKQIKIQWR